MAFGYMSPLEKLVEFFNKGKNVQDFRNIFTKRMMPLRFVGA